MFLIAQSLRCSLFSEKKIFMHHFAIENFIYRELAFHLQTFLMIHMEKMESNRPISKIFLNRQFYVKVHSSCNLWNVKAWLKKFRCFDSHDSLMLRNTFEDHLTYSQNLLLFLIHLYSALCLFFPVPTVYFSRSCLWGGIRHSVVSISRSLVLRNKFV